MHQFIVPTRTTPDEQFGETSRVRDKITIPHQPRIPVHLSNLQLDESSTDGCIPMLLIPVLVGVASIVRHL